MKNLLEYLNMCLEFINERPTKEDINDFLTNIRSIMDTMTIEQIECFEIAFEALDLFYQKQINSISNFHLSLTESSDSSDIQSSFDEKLHKLDDFARNLKSTVLFMENVNDIIDTRKRELLGSTSDEKKYYKKEKTF